MTMPTSIVAGMLSWVSVSQRTFRRVIRRCRIHGSTITLRSSDSAADAYRCVAPEVCATIAVDADSTAPCNANRLTSDRMRRCDSIANDDSSSSAAPRLINCDAQVGVGMSAPEQLMDQQAEHREQERGGEEFRRAENAQFRARGFDQGERGTGDAELERGSDDA